MCRQIMLCINIISGWQRGHWKTLPMEEEALGLTADRIMAQNIWRNQNKLYFLTLGSFWDAATQQNCHATHQDHLQYAMN